MRKIMFLCACIILYTCTNAQSISINTTKTPPDPSSILDIQSTNKGLLIPRLTAEQRIAISAPANGLLVFDIDSATIFMYTGTWKKIQSLSSLSEIIRGVNAGDMLKWDGTKWVVVPLGEFLTYFYRDKDGDGFGDKFFPVAGAGTPLEGFVTNNQDCNDEDSTTNPNKVWYIDADNDGYGTLSSTTLGCTKPNGYANNSNDCNDNNQNVHPNGDELCDGVDNNCDGAIDDGGVFIGYRDIDNDGYGNQFDEVIIMGCNIPDGVVTNADDCDDQNEFIHPGATEICNGRDDDCDNQTDEGFNPVTYYRDADEDGYGDNGQPLIACSQPAGYITQSGDCDDGDASINPEGTEICNDMDDDCNGIPDDAVTPPVWYFDGDGDGYGTPDQFINSCSTPRNYVNNNSDCDDTNDNIHPGVTDICDGVDNDCDAQIDEDCAKTVYYRDADNDGFGNASDTVQRGTGPPTGYISLSGDCNDANSGINPDATETCNGVDDNCNTTIDENAINRSTFYQDNDGDGFGNNAVPILACTKPTGYAVSAGDCNDNNAAVRPGATETCDNLDNNCNGQIDEGVKLTFYQDADGDGFGNPSVSTLACTVPSGYVTNSTDCNDNSNAVKPGATEVCDGVDNNCNGTIDEGVKSTFYRDADNDGYGSPVNTITACSQPTGYVSSSTDCNDNNSNMYPTAMEICDNLDNDCDGQVDEGVKQTFYRDLDGDGFGNAGSTTQACTPPTGYVANNTDCNDANVNVRPNAAEVCDNLDNDCDGAIDEGVQGTFYRDADNDGFGNPTQTISACSLPTGYVQNSLDCNDLNNSVRPGAMEICDNVDNDCDGQIDEGVKLTFYRDVDGDGFGNLANPTTACSAPTGYVSNFTDCNDLNASVRPSAVEVVCDGVDNDCDGVIDEGIKPIYYRDADNDGYGDSFNSIEGCNKPSGYVTIGGDCNDSNPSIRPGAPDPIGDGVDSDCDGAEGSPVAIILFDNKLKSYSDITASGRRNQNPASFPSGMVVSRLPITTVRWLNLEGIRRGRIT